MGFKVEFNNILRLDDNPTVDVGKEYSFEIEGSRIYADDIQIWLTKKNWTVLAEIKITTQTRSENKISGKFKVIYLYSGEEQKMLTDVFKRMYGWK